MNIKEIEKLKKDIVLAKSLHRSIIIKERSHKSDIELRSLKSQLRNLIVDIKRVRYANEAV